MKCAPHNNKKIISLIIGAIAVTSGSANANDFLAEDTARNQNISGFIGFGAGYLPEYEGSQDYQAIPFIAGRIQKENHYIELIGLGVRANVLNDENFQFGPSMRFRFGRDHDVDNARIARLNAIDDALEVGAFARYDFQTGLKPRDSLGFEVQFSQDVSGGHEGYEISLGTNYNAPILEKLRLGIDAGTSYASDNYMDSYYSVTGREAIRSSISQNNAGAGFKDVSIAVNTQYALTRQWGLFSRLSYQYLLGDAADSSIVREEGTENQFLVGAGITYRF